MPHDAITRPECRNRVLRRGVELLEVNMQEFSNENGPSPRCKVAVIETELVGSSFAYALMIREIASELLLIDANAEIAVGEMMNFNHGLSFARPMKIAAGASQRPGETRLDLLGRNARRSSGQSSPRSCDTTRLESS